MDTNLKEKIDIIDKLDTDDSRFVVRVLKSFEKMREALEEKKEKYEIVTNIEAVSNNYNIIDLDKIWTKPYFYTRMRVRLEELVNRIINTRNEELINNPSKVLKTSIYNDIKQEFEKPEDELEIVEFIKSLQNKQLADNYIYVAKAIDEETIFKYEQITTSIEIIKIKDKKEQISKIYDEVYNYLDNDFVSNQYCDFIDNKCIAQRHHKMYPISRKDGCCFMQIRKCTHLENGNCNVKCLPCRLFSCKTLADKGISYLGSDFVLLQAFLDKKQRKHLIFDFWKDKDVIINKIM